MKETKQQIREIVDEINSLEEEKEKLNREIDLKISGKKYILDDISKKYLGTAIMMSGRPGYPSSIVINRDRMVLTWVVEDTNKMAEYSYSVTWECLEKYGL